MKKGTYFILMFALILNISATRNLGKKLTHHYSWQFTMTENELMLIKHKDLSEKFVPYVKFNSNYTFNDTRSAKCGNDIIYNKKGRYYFSNSKLILNYTGGSFSDNVGGNTRQIYVLGKVYYNVTKFNTDTIFLTRVKGNSEKKVSLLEKK